MNKSSNGVFIAIIIILVIGIGAYFLWPSAGSVPVVTPPVTSTSTVPVVTPATTTPVATTTTATTTVATSTPFVLTAAQKAALLKFGISSSSIPNTVSVTQEACFVAKLGVPRVIEIKAGAVPTTAEFLKVQSCI